MIEIESIRLQRELVEQARRIADALHGLWIHFDERRNTCPECFGKGELVLGDNHPFQTCPTCDGEGQVWA